MKLGVVGLPNVGKSTLFNALTGTVSAAAANYPFCTIEPNVGIAIVPDARLPVLAKIYNTQKITPAVLEFVDIAGLVKGASSGEGLGNKFLAHIRETDAIVHVVRCFDSGDIVHVSGKVNPLDDIDIINLELILADMESVDKRIEKTVRSVRGGDKAAAKELELLEKIKQALGGNKPARTLNFNEADQKIVNSFFLITTKPVIYAANVDEGSLNGNEYVTQVKALAKTEGAKCITVCAKIEEELVSLSQEERLAYATELGIKSFGLEQLISAGYDLLGLISYLTAGEKEVRAWTIKKGTKAPQAAGVIHGDFERGFIKAEVCNYSDLAALGSIAAVKEKGLLRIEGKEYVVADGDVILFRFNV
ncbi:MAG: redox-regulated ATPase YchF [Firmicutes bacterium]|nr:redox-regulated ATPase YchF [Bacillota bacterium]